MSACPAHFFDSIYRHPASFAIATSCDRRLEIRNESVMAKKSKPREWTKGDIRALKALARQKLPASKAPATYVVLGKRDGVSILRPKAKPTHFTSKEIRKAIAQSN